MRLIEVSFLIYGACLILVGFTLILLYQRLGPKTS